MICIQKAKLARMIRFSWACYNVLKTGVFCFARRSPVPAEFRGVVYADHLCNPIHRASRENKQHPKDVCIYNIPTDMVIVSLVR